MELILRQWGTFLLVGGASTAFQYLWLWVAVGLGGVDPVWASSVGYPISAAINYYFNYSLTFESRSPHFQTISKFMAVALSGLLLNGIVMYLGTKLIAINYLLTQILATGLVTIWNFCGHRYFSFK